MYPHFIEVTNGRMPVLVNIEHIKYVTHHAVWLANGEIHYSNDGKGPTVTEESYEDLVQLIREAGCQINKGDPRLDSNPLTMEQLKDMIGEPVWDSNKQAWGLVCDHYASDDGFEIVAIRPYKGSSYDYDAEDLIKFPVYRMKV